MILEKVEASGSEVEENFRLVRAMDGNVSVYIDPAALQTLEVMVRESVNAIRGHGVEMGGLVLGRPIDWNSRKLVITGFTPVEIEYRFGPSFRTSPADIEIFKESAAKSGGMAIGCFRTQVRTGMLIRDDDLKLLDVLFGDRDCCFAPIEATVNSPSLLNLHRVRPNHAPRLIARFPVKQSRSGAAEPVLGPVIVPHPVSPAKEQTPASDESAPLVERPADTLVETRRDYRWVFFLAFGLALVGAAFFLGRQYGSRSKDAPRQIAQGNSTISDLPLDLRILAVQSGVEVRWNKNNSGVATAARGLLVLFDGPEPKRIELDPKQVQSGVYSFQARNAKISAWLTIYQANGSFLGDTKEVMLPVSSAALLPERERTPTAPLVLNKPAPGSSKSPPTGVELPTPSPARVQSLVDHGPIAVSEPVRAPDLPDPPPMKPLSVLSLPTPSLPVPDPQKPGLQYKGSVARALPARLLHQVSPSVPAELVAKLRSEVQLEIAVSIDPAGRVTGAQVVSSQGALAGLLAIEVLKAAHLCRFAPAQEDGHPAAGNAVLTFRFAPKSH